MSNLKVLRSMHVYSDRKYDDQALEWNGLYYHISSDAPIEMRREFLDLKKEVEKFIKVKKEVPESAK